MHQQESAPVCYSKVVIYAPDCQLMFLICPQTGLTLLLLGTMMPRLRPDTKRRMISVMAYALLMICLMVQLFASAMQEENGRKQAQS